MGVTLVSLVMMLLGAWAVVTGLNLIGIIELFGKPGQGAPASTGAAMLMVGVLDIVIGAALMTRRYWAWVIALVFLGLTILAGIFALIQHGLSGENVPSLMPAVAAAVAFAYLLGDAVRPYFDEG